MSIVTVIIAEATAIMAIMAIMIGANKTVVIKTILKAGAIAIADTIVVVMVASLIIKTAITLTTPAILVVLLTTLVIILTVGVALLEAIKIIRRLIRRVMRALFCREIKALELQKICNAPDPTSLANSSGFKGNITLFKDNLTIKNLNITGKVFLELNVFKGVLFINNIFRNDAVIQIRNFISALKDTKPEDFVVKFRENKSINNIEITFYNVSYISSSKNKFKANAIFNYDISTFDLRNDATPRLRTIMRFVRNEISRLSINDHCGSKKWDRETMPIRHISFLKGNNVKKLHFETVSNKMYVKSFDTPPIDINSIFFDTREKIEAFDVKAERIPAFALGEPFFRGLKKLAIEKEDVLLESTYTRQEKIFLQKRLFRSQDKFILWWGRFASNTGTSWVKPLAWLFLSQLVLAIITYCIFAGYDPDLEKMYAPNFNIMYTSNFNIMCTSDLDKMCAPDWNKGNPYLDTGWTSFFGLMAWFMNPASFLPPIPITITSWPIYLLFLLQKLFSAVFYYEIIKALRRFTIR